MDDQPRRLVDDQIGAGLQNDGEGHRLGSKDRVMVGDPGLEYGSGGHCRPWAGRRSIQRNPSIDEGPCLTPAYPEQNRQGTVEPTARQIGGDYESERVRHA